MGDISPGLNRPSLSRGLVTVRTVRICGLGVEGGVVQLGVPEQDPNDPDVGADFQ
ncbi:hypothetical protein FB007_12420 [Sinorhizobium medicae]|nr:hypothetical protein FB007_12420 [Sinorhizobium medicae]